MYILIVLIALNVLIVLVVFAVVYAVVGWTKSLENDLDAGYDD